uniref:RING-type domain-containing protein n=1 Tax=Rhabditophanes sp. KR3021 TaxID=114890 RepID=A0AC35TRN4_9BILA
MSDCYGCEDKLSGEEHEDKECPLCMEPFDVDEYDFFPCKCEYQICRFCWHRIRTDESGLCPACRQAYPENPVNFKPPTKQEIQRLKLEKKKQKGAQKTAVLEPGAHLSAYRVLQKNLVYIIGLSQKFTDPDVVKRCEHFSRYGKILKVVTGQPLVPISAITAQTTFTAYITYAKIDQALSCIVGVNNSILDGRMLKASLGTTKYCSNFLRSILCNKVDCMYLHEVADPDFSFTKDDMQLGKHTDCERRLIERVLGTTQPSESSLQIDDYIPIRENRSRSSSPASISNTTVYSDMRLGHFMTTSKSRPQDAKPVVDHHQPVILPPQVFSEPEPKRLLENINPISIAAPAAANRSWVDTDENNTEYRYFQSQQNLENKNNDVDNVLKLNKTINVGSINRIADKKKIGNSVYWDPAVLEVPDEPLKESFDWKKALGISQPSVADCLISPSEIEKMKVEESNGYDILCDRHKRHVQIHHEATLFSPLIGLESSSPPQKKILQHPSLPIVQVSTPSYQSYNGYPMQIGSNSQRINSSTNQQQTSNGTIGQPRAINNGTMNFISTNSSVGNGVSYPTTVMSQANSAVPGNFNFQSFVQQLNHSQQPTPPLQQYSNGGMVDQREQQQQQLTSSAAAAILQQQQSNSNNFTFMMNQQQVHAQRNFVLNEMARLSAMGMPMKDFYSNQPQTFPTLPQQNNGLLPNQQQHYGGEGFDYMASSMQQRM